MCGLFSLGIGSYSSGWLLPFSIKYANLCLMEGVRVITDHDDLCSIIVLPYEPLDSRHRMR